MKIEGEWYFADSTWGGNAWLLRGKSSLSTHNPWTNTYSSIPTLAQDNYDLKKAQFVHVERNAINAIKTEVEKVLNDYANQLADIGEVYVFNPSTLQMVGNDTEMAVAEKIKQLVSEKYEGNVSVSLSNHGYSSVKEFIENGLYIGYQQATDQPYFEYRNGTIERY